MQWNARQREDCIAVALLALLVILAFGNIVFAGRSLMPSHSLNPLDYRLRGPDPVPAEEWTKRGLLLYPNFRDLAAGILQSDPAREFLRRSLARGEFPFWDPYLGGGAPSFASMSPSYLYPPSLLVVLLGNGPLINNIYILLQVFVAGVLAYFFLRRHVAHWLAALAGAAAFMLCGAVVLTVPMVVGQPVALFALPLLMTARVIEVPSVRRTAQLALAFAFMASATFPPMLIQAYAMAVLYLLLARPPKRTLKLFAAGAALSLAIVAFLYLPAIVLMAETTQIRAYYAHAAHATVRPQHIAQILSSKIAGGPATYDHPPVSFVSGSHLYYTGIAALFLAAIGTFVRASGRARTLQLTAIITAVLSLMKLFGVPPIQWLEHVPFLRNFHYSSYLGVALAYSITLLAALAVDALLAMRVKPGHVIAPATALAAALIAMRIAVSARVDAHPNGDHWLEDWRLLMFYLCAATFFAWVAMRKPRTAVMLVVAVLALEGITGTWYPRPRRWDYWAHPPRYIELLQARNTGGRVLPMPILPANIDSVFRIPTLDSILTASPRMYELYRRYFGPIPDVILRESKRIPPERVLDAASIEYFAIVSTDANTIASVARRGYETLHADDYMHLARRATQPRYTFTSQYEVVDARRALEQLPNLPEGSVFVEETPHFASTPGNVVTPRITQFTLNEVTLRVDAPRAGLLVCSESNMSGWSATVDGRPTRILAANYAFRAIEVPAGSHIVHFAYRAPGWIAGVAISIIGLLLCVWGLFTPTSAADRTVAESNAAPQ